MTSIYQQQLGADFGRLHPRIQERLSLNSQVPRGFIGEGTMARVWHRPYTAPFLQLGLRQQILFPEAGEEIPFRIENYAFRDPLGRETVAWIRRFAFPRVTRCFDATMIHSAARHGIVDYLGTHQRLAVDIELGVSARGGLLLRSGEQRFYAGARAFRVPKLLLGQAQVEEWFEEADGQYHIRVAVHNPVLGALFGYQGAFRGRWQPLGPAGVPPHALPIRTEARE